MDVQHQHHKLVATLKREQARRKSLGARLRFHAQRQSANERMRHARLAMKQQAARARQNAEQARRRTVARRRDVRR
jgi:hypothetical protein